MTATRLPTLALLALAASAASASTTSRSGAAAPRENLPVGVLDRVFASGSDTIRGGSPVTVYTDRAAFLAALAPGYAAHDFSEIAPGTSQPIEYTDGADAWHYIVFTGVFATHPLYDGAGFISTDRVDDPISVATSIPVKPPPPTTTVLRAGESGLSARPRRCSSRATAPSRSVTLWPKSERPGIGG